MNPPVNDVFRSAKSSPVVHSLAEDQVFIRCAWRIVPFVTLLYFMNFMDRSNVAFAALTMNRDLGFSASVYGFGAGVFFWGISLFAIPATLLLERAGARRVLFGMLVLWSIASGACAAIQGPTSFYILRFLLGVAEAGFYPGVLFYLLLWFPQKYLATALAIFIAGGPLSNVLSGPFAALLLAMNGYFHLRGWQWLFLLEAVPAFCLAFAALAFLPNTPCEATWLTPAEKQLIAHRMNAETASHPTELWPTLRDQRVWALALVYFGLDMSVYGFNFWLPQIVQQMGYSITAIGFIVAAIYSLAILAQLASAHSSDRRGERVIYVVAAATFAAGGWLLTATVAGSVLPTLFALVLVRCGLNSSLGPLFALAASLHRGPAAAAGLALMSSVGGVGAFAGPAIMGVLKQTTGTYATGMCFLAIGLLVAAAAAYSLGRSMAPRHAVVRSQPA